MRRENYAILVVDDNPSSRYAMARTLRAAGYRTIEASSGAEALEFAGFVSAVILDVHLPDLLGWEVCRLLRARLATANLPVIHVTARYTSEEDKLQSASCGANAFFVGPVAPEDLVDTVDGLVSGE
jgi:DNA-binding response OmpR family regulator